MKAAHLVIILLAIIIPASFVWWYGASRKDTSQSQEEVTDFESCARAGNPVMELYPRQCITPDGRLFVEDVTVAWEAVYTNASADMIRNISPAAGDTVASPLTISGEARGLWFFEASFPITLVDWDGRIIAESFATAQSDWMTEEFVPFTATIDFETPPGPGGPVNRGALILKRDNPSGLPEHDAALEIPIIFSSGG